MQTVSIPMGGFNRSGGVKTLVLLANALAAGGWRVRMIVPDYAADSPFELAPTVALVRLGTGGLPGMARKVAYYLRLATCAAAGADLCLANFYVTAYCALLSKLTNPGARVIYFVQGDEAASHGTLAGGTRLGRVLRHAFARRSYRLPVRILSVSRWLLQRIGRPDGEVVGQGIDLSVFRPDLSRSAGRASVVVGTVGSPGAAKGYPDVLRALDILGDHPEISVLVAGDEALPLPAGFRARRVEPASEREMADFYHGCDVFVFASLSEGFGLPPLEAMACGAAVVTTACGGVSEFAVDGANCLMVPAGDPGALARAVQRLCLDGALRRRLATAGIATAQGFARDRMLSRFLSMVEAGAASGADGRPARAVRR